MSILYIPHFWALISLILLVLVLYKKVSGATGGFLQSKINDIKTEIDNSEHALSAALHLLNERKSDLNNLETILDKEITSQKLKVEATYEKLIVSLKNHHQTSIDNINSYYAEEFTKLEKEKINQFILVVSNIISSSISQNTNHSKLIDQSIDTIKQQLSNNN